ncbi:hypothetical protein [Mesorhizobium sp.]|uniref:hypothetical protein n=1 Tax=Mesorhizobium sp. TaxID=1871066 RepID=UPI001221E0C6|nr:hypothetical protein [Mesorhizobium sp.]TIL64208.1 MAG: hypothetical protein E5Y77_27595 [Mesorhizobium sp.]TIP08022.1 MAG: hypothetical protein E5X73_34140 [Mesorhizobium sp.]
MANRTLGRSDQHAASTDRKHQAIKGRRRYDNNFGNPTNADAILDRLVHNAHLGIGTVELVDLLRPRGALAPGRISAALIWRRKPMLTLLEYCSA